MSEPSGQRCGPACPNERLRVEGYATGATPMDRRDVENLLRREMTRRLKAKNG